MARLFLDANIPTYAAGRSHPLKEPCKEVLVLAARRPDAFFTNAEVLQELLHRYLTFKRLQHGKRVVEDFAAVMEGSVEGVLAEDVLLACRLAERYAAGPGPGGLAARDLLHAAVMLRDGSTRIVTADKDFDGLVEAGIERLDPARIDDWRGTVANQVP